MNAPRHTPHPAQGPRRDPASTAALPPGPGAWRRPAPRASRAREVPDGRRLAAAGSFGTVAAGAVVGLLSRWRPLVLFWACVLAVLAAGGAVLHGLGPPPQASAEAHARRAVEARAAPEMPPPVPASAPLAAPPAGLGPVAPAPPVGPRPIVPTPIVAPPSRPPADARASGDAAREGAGAGPGAADRAEAPPRPGDPVLFVFHPPGSESGKTVAQHLAARVGLGEDRITTEPVPDTPARAIIRFHVPADHPLARRLGRELAQLGYAWQIENLSARPPSGRRAVEVWLPNR